MWQPAHVWIRVAIAGGAAGAVNAWLCYAGLPRPVAVHPTFAWDIVPAGAAHGAILAACAVVGRMWVLRLRWSERAVMATGIGWLAGYLSWQLLRMSIDRDPRWAAWPFDLGWPGILTMPFAHFGLVAAIYCLAAPGEFPCRYADRRSLAGAVGAGIAGSLWWWVAYEQWYLSLLHGAIWGLGVAFATASRRERLAPRHRRRFDQWLKPPTLPARQLLGRMNRFARLVAPRKAAIMTHLHRFHLVAVIALSLPWVATAQAQSPSANPWRHGTTVSGFAGVALDSHDTGSALGGALGWELTPKVGIEGSAAWLDRGDGSDAFGAALKVRAALFGRDRVAPFMVAGVGAYRASYSSLSTDVPSFYRRRMSGQPGPGEMTFTDPSLIVGGGLSFFVNRHLSVRPEVDSMVVIDDSHAYVVTTVAFHVAFHFEEHPVTPSRRRR